MTEPELGRPAHAAGLMPEPWLAPWPPTKPELSNVSVSPLDDAGRSRRAAVLGDRVLGRFKSVKTGRSLPWSCIDEQNLMALLETDAEVLSYERSPELVQFTFGDRTFQHVPAFRVHVRRGHAIIDVRCRDEDGLATWQAPRASSLAAIYMRRGIPYRSLTSLEISVAPRLGNALTVATLGGEASPGEGDAALVTAAVSAAGCVPLGELARGLRKLANPLRTICAMAIAGSLTIDLWVPDPLQMPVRLPAGEGVP